MQRWLTAFSLCFTLLMGVAGPAVAQNALLDDDIDFARTLARYRYFDLASDLLEDLAASHPTPADQRALSFAKASILRVAAEYESDASSRAKYFENAIEGYRTFLASVEPDHPRYQQARLELGEVLIGHGKFLRDQVDLAPSDGEAMREKASEEFKEAVSLLNGIYQERSEEADALKDQGDHDNASKAYRDAFLGLYQKGVCYYEWALTFPIDSFNRSDYLDKSATAFEDFLFENEEPGLLTSYAYFYQGLANSELAKLPDASDSDANLSYALSSLRYVLDDDTWGLWSVLEANPNLDTGWLGQIKDLAEQVTYAIADVELRRGDAEAAIKAVETLEEKRKQFSLGKPGPYGDFATLMLARALYETGNKADAIRKAQEVAQRNASNRVGIEAQTTLSRWIGGEGNGVARDVPPDVLFTAAEGQFNQDKFFEAIAQYHMVLRQLVRGGDEQMINEYGPRCWYRIGQSFGRLRRYLEAAVAYEEGLKKYPNQTREMKEDNATGYYNALLRRSVETKQPFDIKRKDAVREEMVRLGIGDLQFLIARDRFADAKTKTNEKEQIKAMQEALREFERVEENSVYYERAWVHRARCQFAMGHYDKALNLLDEYVKYTQDLHNTPGPDEQQQRDIALADTSYYRGLFLKEHAGKLRDEATDAAQRAEAFEEFGKVLDAYKNFEAEHGEMKEYQVLVDFHRLDSRVGRAEMAPDLATAQRELAEAQALLGKLKNTKHRLATFALYRMAKGHLAVYKMYDDPKSDDARSSLQQAADFMFAFSEAKNHNSFLNLRNTGDWYFELDRWEQALTCYQKLIARFGESKNSSIQQTLEQNVRRNMALCYNELHQFDKAKPLWDVFKPEASSSISVIRGAAMCYGGWLEENGSEFVEVPGSGDYAKAVQLWSKLLTDYFRGGKGKYSPEWWDVKFMTLYTRYRAGFTDPSYTQQARTLLRNQKAFKPDFGGDRWRPRFRWLEKQIQ